METTNTVGVIEVRVLTPVHIGTGQKMHPNSGFVYFPAEKRVAVLDEEKVLDIVGAGQIGTWVGLIHKKESLHTWLTGIRKNLQAAEVASRTMHTPGGLGTTNEFRPLMHTGGEGNIPYVPGSSVKGAVRTALFADAVRSWGQHLREFPPAERIGGKFSAEQMTKSVFGKDPNHDYLRLLHIGDSHFSPGSTWCLKAQVLNQHSADQNDPDFKLEIPHLLEVLPVGATATATWQLAGRLASLAKAERVLAPPAALNDLGTLLKALKDHTLRLVEKELTSLPARHLDAYGEELSKIADACRQCVDGREAVLRVGFGSGYAAMTGDWIDRVSQAQRDKIASTVRDKPWKNKFYPATLPFPKSRKLVPDATDGTVAVPLGFIKLTLLTEKDQAVRAEQAQQQAAERAAKAAENAAKAAQQALDEAAEALRRAEAAKVPEYFTGIIKEGAVVDAIYEGADRANPKMRWFRLLLLAPGKEQRVSLALASFDATPGMLMRVELKAVVKGKGVVQAIQNPKPKIAL